MRQQEAEPAVMNARRGTAQDRASAPLAALLFRHTLALAWIAGIFANRWPAPAGVLCLLLLWVDGRCRHAATILAVCAAFALGLCAAHTSIATPHLPAWAFSKERLRLSGMVDSVQGMPGGRLRIILHDVRPIGGPAAGTEDHASGIRLVWTWDKALCRPLPGQRAEITARLRSTAGFANLSLPDYGGTWAARGICRRIWSEGARGDPLMEGEPSVSAALREHLRRAVVTMLAGTTPPAGSCDVQGTTSPASGMSGNLPAQHAAFIPALLFGDRSGFSQHSISMLSAASLLHSIALSGQHLAFMALLGLGLAHMAGWLHPASYLRVPRPRLALWCSLPPALAYLWLGAAPPSLTRAACMLLLLALWRWRGGVHTALDILLDAVTLITICRPAAAYEVGLQLSALAVGGLACAAPWLGAMRASIRRRLHGMPRSAARCCGALLDVALCSAAVSLAILPLAVHYFQNTGWWFPLNALWLPVLGMWVLPLSFIGLGLAVCGLTGAGTWSLQLASLPCGWLMDALSWLDGQGLLATPALPHPHWLFWLAWLCLLAGLCLRARRPAMPPAGKRYLLASGAFLCAGICLLPCWRQEIRLSLLDVGHGQAALLETPSGWRLLADGGNAGPHFDCGAALVLPRLCYNHLPTLDAVLASHPDRDHTGGLGAVLNGLHVREIFHNGEVPAGNGAAFWKDQLASHSQRQLYAGDSLDLGDGLRLEVVHPPRDWTHTGNNASLVLRLTRHGQGLLLLTGDAERPALASMLHRGADLRARVVIAPHHGADSSFFAALYAAARPDLVLASCARDSRWNFPGKRLRAFLEQGGIPLLTTAALGEIDIVWPKKGGWRLEHARKMPPEGISPDRMDVWLEE